MSSLTRRGRTIDCLVSVTPLRSADGGPTGVIILMDEAPAEQSTVAATRLLDSRTSDIGAASSGDLGLGVRHLVQRARG